MYLKSVKQVNIQLLVNNNESNNLKQLFKMCYEHKFHYMISLVWNKNYDNTNKMIMEMLPSWDSTVNNCFEILTQSVIKFSEIETRKWEYPNQQENGQLLI